MAELVPPREGLYESTDGSTFRVEASFYDRAYEQMCTLIEKGSLSDWECYYFRKDGKLVPVEQTMFYIYGSEGDRIGVVTINRDISERKNAEKKLFEAKNFLDDIIRTSADGIIVSDTRGTITLVNDAAQRLLGYSKDELLGKNVHDFMVISCETREADFRKTSLNPLDSVFYYEATWAAQGGRLVDLEMSMGILRDVKGDMTGMVACIRDITERKAWEKKLFEYQDQLRSLTSQLTLTEEQERKRIAAEIHDSISQSLALAKIKLGTLMQKVSSAAARDVAAIRSLLDQSIQEARSLMFDLSPPFLYEFGLKKALEWVLEDMEKQHGIKTRLAWNGNEEIHDDDVRIIFYQSIRELLINVVKHAQAKTATVMVSKDDKWMRVRIEDDGKGFLVSPDGFKVSAQSGYGLFSISERFQLLGGALTVESELSLGTTVDLELPLVQHTA
jgi:PAS domain S-box-containing protein